MYGIEMWERYEKPPASALKLIAGGRMKGKSDINPQWRIRMMTEVYGLCGIGWKYTVDRKWLEPGSDGQVVAFVDVSLYVKVGDTWSDAIPGTGGAAFITKESTGLFTSDEAYKMALTDALSVAMKAIGVAAAIYEGRWDGTKYREETADDIITESELADIYALAREVQVNLKDPAIEEKTLKYLGVSDYESMRRKDARKLVALLESRR